MPYKVHSRNRLAAVSLCVSAVSASSAFNVCLAQAATVTGQILLRDADQPLPFTTVSVLSHGIQLLTSEAGRFTVPNLVPGEVRLRFKRIGFSPRDTVLTLAANDTARFVIRMARLAILLPEVVVNRGKCTNAMPLEPKTPVLAQLFDQLNQNAERFKLLAQAMPFRMHVYRLRGLRNNDNKIVPTRIDTVVRGPFPAQPYRPKHVLRRSVLTTWAVGVPELPDYADTAFTNNHCFFYAGQSRRGEDSVIAVDFEPTEKIDRDVDIEGTMYLRVDTYELVETITRLNKVPAQLRRNGLLEHSVRVRFGEIVNGITVLEEWDLTNRYRPPRATFVERGQVFNVTWADSAAKKP
jgi:hypothetical protein